MRIFGRTATLLGGIITAAFLPLGCSAATPNLSPHIKAVLAEDVLSLANDRIERRFRQFTKH